jgi:hypothetical protein
MANYKHELRKIWKVPQTLDVPVAEALRIQFPRHKPHPEALKTTKTATKSIHPTGLSPDTLLLRQDLVRSGDVLLTYGRGSESKTIAAVTSGEFSHAAVFISPLDLLESFDLVAHSSIDPVGQAVIQGKRVFLARLPHDPLRATLWRHPSADAVSRERFAKAYSRLLEEQLGMDYPPRDRLVHLAQVPTFLKDRLKKHYHGRAQTPIPGDFCSQLVARFYEYLKVPLFDDRRGPDKVSPNHLAECKLTQVAGAILGLRDVPGFKPQPMEIGGKPVTGFTSGDADDIAGMMRRGRLWAKDLDALDALLADQDTKPTARTSHHPKSSPKESKTPFRSIKSKIAVSVPT